MVWPQLRGYVISRNVQGRPQLRSFEGVVLEHGNFVGLQLRLTDYASKAWLKAKRAFECPRKMQRSLRGSPPKRRQ